MAASSTAAETVNAITRHPSEGDPGSPPSHPVLSWSPIVSGDQENSPLT